jgi:hypothetical protein
VVLFTIPVTKKWLRQLIVALVLICHSSLRGVVEILRDVFDYDVSLGTVFNVLHAAVEKARVVNARQDLSKVRVGAHDEVFQSGQPILVGVCAHSTYCYLLAAEDHRDGETWGVRLLDLEAQGFRPRHTVADAGQGLRAGQVLAMPGVPCHGDVFHALRDVGQMVTFLENRAYGVISVRDQLEHKMVRLKGVGEGQKLSKRLALARKEEVAALELVSDVAILTGWLQNDILSIAGPDLAARQKLYDFVVEELRAREQRCMHRIGPVRRALENQRDTLLAFAANLDTGISALSDKFGILPGLVREVILTESLDPKNAKRRSLEASLRQKLGSRFEGVQQAVAALVQDTVRASSIVENVNSRVRPYIFLRRHLGSDSLELLRFFLNHRRFMRSDHAVRVDKSPAELLTGTPMPHWIELLGFERFSRN